MIQQLKEQPQMANVRTQLQKISTIPQGIRDEVIELITKGLGVPIFEHGADTIENLSDNIREGLSAIYTKQKIERDIFQENMLQIAQIIQSIAKDLTPYINYTDLLCGPDVPTLLLTSSSLEFHNVNDKTYTEKNALIKRYPVQVVSDIVNGTGGVDTKLGMALDILKSTKPQNMYQRIQSVQIWTHGSLLSMDDPDFQKGTVYLYNDSTGPYQISHANSKGHKKQTEDMVFKFTDNMSVYCIKASDLFTKIKKTRFTEGVFFLKKDPLFVITSACHGGQARNDVEFLGENATLLTFTGRKYTTRAQYNILNIAMDMTTNIGRLKGTIHHMGPFSWIRECVLNGVSCNISLTDKEGKKITFNNKTSNDINSKTADSIKVHHGLGMLQIFSAKFSDSTAALTWFKEYLKAQYDGVVDQIPDKTLECWGCSSKQAAKNMYSDTNFTEVDMYRALFTHLAFVLDSENKDSTAKDKKELLQIMSNAQHPVNQGLKRLIGIDLSCEKLQQLLLPNNAGVFLQIMRQSDSKRALHEFITSHKGEPQYTEALYELCRNTGGPILDAKLCSAAKGSTVEDVKTIQILHSPLNTTQRAILSLEPDLDISKYSLLCSATASLLGNEQYENLCLYASKPQFTLEKIQALCTPEASCLGSKSYTCLIALALSCSAEDIYTLCKAEIAESGILANPSNRVSDKLKAIVASYKTQDVQLKLREKMTQKEKSKVSGDQVRNREWKNLQTELQSLKYLPQQMQGQQESSLLQKGSKQVGLKTQEEAKQNLRRWGKWRGEVGMMEELVAANVGKGAVLEEMRRRAEAGADVLGNVTHGSVDHESDAKVHGLTSHDSHYEKSGKVGQVELVGEVHDEHGASVRALVERMEKMSDEEGKRSVIALERKEGGEHLGMRDVRLLAEVMKYNEGCKEEERIALPAGIEGTALWWDAKLVNEAQKHGVQVVGVEGKGLAHGHGTQEYNADREDYMAQKLQQLQRQGYNVVMPVGEAHVKGLQSRLGASVVVDTMGTMQQNNQQNSQSKEHDILQLSVNAEMEARQQNNQQNSQSNGQSTSRATQTTAKKVYGKFTERLAESGSQSHGMV